MRGNFIFLAGAALEIVGLCYGVDSWAVAASVIAYGAVLLVTGYLS
jgi:hypothetical protein